MYITAAAETRKVWAVAPKVELQGAENDTSIRLFLTNYVLF